MARWPDRPGATGAFVGRNTPYARLLEDRPTGAAGVPIAPERALSLLESGQAVTCTVGGRAGTPASSADELAEALYVALRAVELPAAARGEPADADPRRAGAEILTVHRHAGRLALALDEAPLGLAAHHPAVVDFADVTGTYYLVGSVVEAHLEGDPWLWIEVHLAHRVQLRRFVRVPVLISPHCLEVLAGGGDAAEEWQPLLGEIVDLSLGGLGLLAGAPLPAEARVRATFDLPGRFGALTVEGCIVAPPAGTPSQPSAGAPHPLAYRRGVTFDPLMTGDLRRLQRALSHRQAELRRLSQPGAADPPAPDGGDPGDGAPSRRPRFRWQFWR